MQKHYLLSDAMREFVQTGARFGAADDTVKAMREAYDALCRHFTPARDARLAIEKHAVVEAGRRIPVRL